MSRKRPVIGITGPDEGGTGAWLFTALSVRLAGGKPRRITVESPAVIDEIDGLIIGGGADVEPLKYGQKRIEIQPGSRLAEILETTICNVNALHNQAIDLPGDGVELVAKEKNTDITQGLEHPDYDFVIGVQWHPEYLVQVRRQRRLFKELVRTAKDKESQT